MKATVYLSREGAFAYKASDVGTLGGTPGLNGHQTLQKMKLELQSAPVEQFLVIETTQLPEWEGDIKERAAVALGHRKKFARFIEKVESE